MLILVLLCLLPIRNCQPSGLVWIPNHEGLFSQFLQSRVMVNIARDLDSVVVVAALSTKHFSGNVTCLCEVFQCPKTISCAVGNMSCSRDSAGASAIRLCYHGALSNLGENTRREVLLRAVSFAEPALSFQPYFYNTLRAAKERLFRLMPDDSRQYTVVHWRRGDQLTSRCAQGKDASVNCESVNELMQAIKALSSNSAVYIAANAASVNSDEVHALNRAGFQTATIFHDMYDPQSVTAAVVDTLLMLDATTFLGWGVSIMNDLVEHERMLRNRTWCAARETHFQYPTWCWLQQQQLEKSRGVPGHAGVSDRDLLLREEEVMQHAPLLLSAYNTSGMPAYLEEVRLAKQRAQRERKDARSWRV